MRAKLRYLAVTRNYFLVFRSGATKGVTAQGKAAIIRASSDTDWANDNLDRRSITGSIIKYNGCPVAWVSKRQEPVTLSTADAEYRSIADIVQRSVYVRNLLGTLHKENPKVVFETDN